MTRAATRRVYLDAVEDWWDRALALIPTLSPEEQHDLDSWSDGSPERRTSLWPGWVGRIEPHPRPTVVDDVDSNGWVVYRLRDDDGRLLYIGKTSRVRDRVADHRRKPWGKQNSSIVVEKHPTEVDALIAELRAIQAEQPRYNVVGRR